MKMLDHFDWLDYTFLGFCVIVFSIAVAAIMRGKPYRQFERKPRIEPTED